MSDKSGASPQAISVPSGGGAIRGIGEAFSPDLFTGTGSLSIPLPLLPGRNGFGPKLNLVYSSTYGNGPFGLGWSLDVPQIARKTSRGIPRYQDDADGDAANDSFVLTGADDLVAVERLGDGITAYRPRTEGLFARIERHRWPGVDRWVVHTRDGLRSVYGDREGEDDAPIVADPERPARIFAWKLAETSDPFGNRIRFDYRRDRGGEGGRRWDQLYLERIRYVDVEDAGRQRYLVSVTLHHEPRPDPFSEYRGGFEIRTQLRCTAIEMQTHATGDTLAHRCRLSYVDERVRAGELPESHLPANGASLLGMVTFTGHDGSVEEALPPLELGYTAFEPARRRFQPIRAAGDSLPPRSLADGAFELVDLFGDGLPDLVQMDGVVQFWRNLGDGAFDAPQAMTMAPVGIELHRPGVQLADMDGDGRADLLVVEQGGYFPLSFEGGWTARRFIPYAQPPPVDFGDGRVRLLDLDGDGVVDALRTGDSFELYLNDPAIGWEREERPRLPIEQFPNISFEDPRVKLGSMTASGLQDIVLVEQGQIHYWPNLGHGRWGRRITMRSSPGIRDLVPLPDGDFDPRRVLLGDVDGDGLADLVYVEPARITVWINRAGETWGDAIVIDGTPPFTDIDGVRLADLLGTGMAGILWTADRSAEAPDSYQFLDLTGSVKPYLLHTIDNHRGALTRVSYAPSTRFAVADARSAVTRWRTTLPFPVQVVERVESIDQLSLRKSTSVFSYHHGYWDGVEREFRGFGRVDRTDSESFERYHEPGLFDATQTFDPVPREHFAPPTLTRTWFHVGAIEDDEGAVAELDLTHEQWAGDPAALARPDAVQALLSTWPPAVRRRALRSLRGTVLRTELYAVDGSALEDRPYTVTEHLVGTGHLPVGSPWPERPEGWQQRVFHPYRLATRTTEWERGDEPRTRVGFVDDHDVLGRPRSTTELAFPRRDGEVCIATHTVTRYARADGVATPVLDRVARVMTFEIVGEHTRDPAAIHARILDGATERRVIADTRTYYDGAAFVGLPEGQHGPNGALVRTETLILTPALLARAYRDVAGGPPPYLIGEGEAAWTDEYPEAFRALPRLGGHVRRAVTSDDDLGLYAVTERRQYNGRGLITVRRDALDRDSTITYDRFQVLPVQVTTPPAGPGAAPLVTSAIYDERLFLPNRTVDANGNQTVYRYTPLGLLASVASLGKDPGEGDTEDRPGTRFEYDLSAFTRRQPISVHTISRVEHRGEATIEKREYSDGSGRLLQTRSLADDILFLEGRRGGAGLPILAGQNAPCVGSRRRGPDLPNVVVTGWNILDNKGQVVTTYEPYFAEGWSYRRPEGEELGESVRCFRDAVGRVVRTVQPDGSELRVVFGEPFEQGDPDRARPTPWVTYSYDANDNAGRTHPQAASAYRTHWNTPSSVITDALGRAVAATRRSVPGASEQHTVHTAYDITGNIVAVFDVDDLERPVLTQVHDLAGRVLRTESSDAGVSVVAFDAAGQALEHRRANGALILETRDALDRSSCVWARDRGDETVTLRELTIHGDQPASGLTANEARARNLLGRVHHHQDEAGRVVIERNDFKGNPLEVVRQVIADAPIIRAMDRPDTGGWTPFRVDWTAPSDQLLDPTEYRTSTRYDALNRPTSVSLPRGTDGVGHKLTLHHGRAGGIERLDSDDTTVVQRVAYDAKGRRTLVALGNGVMIRRATDPQTLRLRRMRSEGYVFDEAALTYRPTGAEHQDLEYSHDLAGNVLAIAEHATERRFAYDPLYRLVSATGRECDRPPARPWDPAPRCEDATRTRAYRETYRYDRAGNLDELSHRAGDDGFTRSLRMQPGSHRLAGVTIGETAIDYQHDASGNVIRETASRELGWDRAGRLRSFMERAGDGAPSVVAVYLYDTHGARVKKVLRKAGGQIETTVAIGGAFEHHTRIHGSTRAANNTIHIADGEVRFALIRVGPRFDDEVSPDVTFVLGDHTGSSHVIVDANGRFVRREEFTPYGETSYGGYARKRFRFIGRERDEESGLHHCRHRYAAPWLARWTSPDPAGVVDGPNLYTYAANNPLRYRDANGLQSGPNDDAPFNPVIEITGKGICVGSPSFQIGGKSAQLEFPMPGQGAAMRATIVGPLASPGDAAGDDDVPPGSDLKTYSRAPAANRAWRRSDIDASPQSKGFQAKDPNATFTPGEHALNEHAPRGSQYLSASRKPGGATNIVGKPWPIDVDAARDAGVTMHDTRDIAADLQNHVARGRFPQRRVDIWARQQGPGGAEGGEVLFEQHVPAMAVETPALRGIRTAGRALFWAAVAYTAYDLAEAASTSARTGSFRPLAREIGRQATIWGYALAVGEVGATIGSLLGGPIGAAIGGLIGGFIGALVGSSLW